MNNKIKDLRNQLENTSAKRDEIIECIQTLDAQLLQKRNDLNSVLESSQTKELALERYRHFVGNIRCRNWAHHFKFRFSNSYSEHKRDIIRNKNFESKLELAEQQVEDMKLTQEHLITMGVQVVDHIENFKG